MDGVAGWFEKRGEIPLASPRGVREYGPISDDPERPDDHFPSDDIRGLAFALEYCDARGWASTRTIRCLGLDPRYPAALKAYCNVRHTTRAFRVDRIISIANYRTGRVLTGAEHVALLSPYLPAEQLDAAMRAECNLRRATKDGVFALLQIAMADGKLDEKAQAIVIDYVRAEAEAMQCDLSSYETVELWVDNLAPPLESVVSAITNLLDTKDKFVRLLPWLLKVARTRDSFAEQEQSVRELIGEVRLHFRRKLLEWPSTFRASRELHAS